MSGEHDVTLAAGYVLGTLDAGEREAFERHLPACTECQREVRSLERVTTALATAAPLRTPRQELRERVLGSVAVPPAPVAPPRFSWSDPRAWLPAAALLAVSIGLGAHAIGLQRRVGSLEARLDIALRDVAASQVATANAEGTAMRAALAMAVLSAPDMARIDLAGQKVSPDARARAFWSRNRGLVIAANNLPALQPGRTYQVWVLPASGAAPISAGLLIPDGAGSATVTYATSPDIPAPGAVAVSEEPAGGVPAPTGQLYLVGKA